MLRETDEWFTRIKRAIREPPAREAPRWKALTARFVRLVAVVLRDLINGDLTLWTMSLVYTTLLSMVPMLALSFSVLKAFGVHNQIKPLLQNLLAPLGEEGNAITSRLIGFIEHVNVGVLGAVGLALLLYTVISLMQKIEEAFNAIWHVTRLRSLGDRFSRYLSVLLVGPLLIFAALGITATALNSEMAQRILALRPLGSVVVELGRVLPYALVIAAFTFLYRFVPNTRVRLGPALAAGFVGGILWQSAGWAFAVFVASSTSYAAIYSSFAILILFLIWLYVSWLVLLVGASVSFYLQNPQYLYAAPGEPRLSNRMRERLAVAIMQLIGAHFVRGERPWTVDGLTRRLGVPMHPVDLILDALVQGGIVKQTGDDPPAYLPARDLAEVSVAQVLATIRATGESDFLNPDLLPPAQGVDNVMTKIEKAIADATADRNLRALAIGPDASDRRRDPET
jgi:membrane protein